MSHRRTGGSLRFCGCGFPSLNPQDRRCLHDFFRYNNLAVVNGNRPILVNPPVPVYGDHIIRMNNQQRNLLQSSSHSQWQSTQNKNRTHQKSTFMLTPAVRSILSNVKVIRLFDFSPVIPTDDLRDINIIKRNNCHFLFHLMRRQISFSGRGWSEGYSPVMRQGVQTCAASQKRSKDTFIILKRNYLFLRRIL